MIGPIRSLRVSGVFVAGHIQQQKGHGRPALSIRRLKLPPRRTRERRVGPLLDIGRRFSQRPQRPLTLTQWDPSRHSGPPACSTLFVVAQFRHDPFGTIKQKTKLTKRPSSRALPRPALAALQISNRLSSRHTLHTAHAPCRNGKKQHQVE